MRIGRYEVVRGLGQGGMGRVLLGRDASGAEVAIKLLLRPDSTDARARFEREARLLASLGEAEGFVPILESGESQGYPFLVMPVVAGGTLRDRLARGPMPIADAVALLGRIATAVGRAHALGIVHRDLKPENILFTEGGAPLVADLGLAKHFLDGTRETSRSVSLTRAGELKGTAGYMAPEQMHDAKNAGPPADVFALGALLFEAVAGEPAFRGESPLDVIGKVAAGKVAPLTAVRPDAPRWLADVVARALAPSPGERFPDAAAFAGALAARIEKARRRTWIPLLLAVVLAASVAAIRVRFRPPAESAPLPAPAKPALAVVGSAGTTAATSPFPDECRGFLSSQRMKLVAVFGTYALKLPDPVAGVAISPDGARALTGDRQGRLWLWDLATWRVIHVLAGEERAGSDAAWCANPTFLPDGKRAVSATRSGFFRIWDLETGTALATLPGDQGPIFSIAVSADGKIAATGGQNATIGLWDLDGVKAVATLKGETGGNVHALSFSGSGALLIAATDKSVGVWDVPERRLIGAIPEKGATTAALSADGSRALIGLGNSTIRLIETETMAELRSFTGHRLPLTKVAFFPDGKRALSASIDRTLKLWDLASGAALRSFDGHGDRVSDFAVTEDGSRILSGSRDQQAILWDAATGKDLRGPVGPGGPVHAVALARSGRLALAGGADGQLRLLDGESAKLVRTIGRHEDRILGTALSPDGKSALSGSADGFLALWDTATGEKRLTIKAHEGATRAVAFLDDRLVVSGGDDGKVCTWELGGGAQHMSYEIGSRVLAVAATSEMLFAGCDSRHGNTPCSLALVDLATGIVARKSGRSSSPVIALAISADQKTGVTGALDGSLRPCDMRARTPGPRAFSIHRSMVTAVAAGSDFFLSSGLDGTIRITSAKGEEIDQISLATANDHVDSLALAFDERSFIAGTTRGVVLRFELRRP